MKSMFRNMAKSLIYRSDRFRYYSSKREARILRKMIIKEEKRSKKNSSVPTACTLHQYARSTLYNPENRRSTILNKIFMDNISDLMTTGTYSDEIYEHGIHITQTKITANHHLLYVYWIHSKDINETEVDNLLKKVASYLRQELTSSGFMGQIPEVRFVKDEHFIKMQYTEEILDKILLEEKKWLAEQNLEENYMPTKLELPNLSMEYNVFGLDYLKIMNNIKKSMKGYTVRPGEVESNAEEKEKTKKHDKKELARAIFSKRYEMKKIRRASKKAAESSFLEVNSADFSAEEAYENWPADDNEVENNHDDFIDEVEDEKN